MRNPLPQHIAIIMDGNRTWAKDNGISTIKGGVSVLKQLNYPDNIIKMTKTILDKI